MPLATADALWSAWQAEAEDSSTVFPTGYPVWDSRLKRGGLRRQMLYGLAARSGVGKTTLAVNITNALVQGGHAVLFLSSEMPASGIANRLLGVHFQLPVREIEEKQRDGWLQPWVREEFQEDFRLLVVDDTRKPNLDYIRRSIEQFAFKVGRRPAVVIQDHAGLISTDGMYGADFVKYNKVLQELKVIAGEQSVAFLTLLQLGRQADSDDRKNFGHIRVVKEDLYGGGEAHFDAILTAYRPSLDPDAHDENLAYGDSRQQERYDRAREKALMFKDQVFLGLAKNRDGDDHVHGDAHHINWRTLQVTPEVT